MIKKIKKKRTWKQSVVQTSLHYLLYLDRHPAPINREVMLRIRNLLRGEEQSYHPCLLYLVALPF